MELINIYIADAENLHSRGFRVPLEISSKWTRVPYIERIYNLCIIAQKNAVALRDTFNMLFSRFWKLFARA